MLRTALAVAAILAAAPLCPAGDEYELKTLSIGDPAPALDIAHWLKGDRVESFEDGKVYVVEFWGTWCGPCKASVPHLAELQETTREYGVTFIGVSDEDLQKVVGFLAGADKQSGKLWYDAMGYTVVTDPDKSTHQAYMTASGMKGIPAAFIVGKDQKIEWIGRPNFPKGDIDRVLDAVVRDSWDREAFRSLFELRKQADQEYAAGNAEQAVALSRQLIELDPAGAAVYQEKMLWAMLTKLDRPAEAYAIARDLMKANWEDPAWLNGLAWNIATLKGIKTRDLDLALRAALQANDLTGSDDAAILDTVARVYFEKGDVKSAAKWQRKAVELLKEGDESALAKDLRATLEKYEKE